MNTYARAIRLPGGVTLAVAVRPGQLPHGEKHADDPARRRLAPQAPTAKNVEDTSFSFVEPLRFHWARYEYLTRLLQSKRHLAAALLSCVILIMLRWKAESGAPISPVRWLYAGVSGWFIVSMSRLALFTCLAAPRFICHAQGKLRISGLGTVRAEHILNWSIERGVVICVRAKRGVKLHLCCRWFGWRRHWTMLMEDGPEVERLRGLLEAALPRPAAPNVLRIGRAIPIEA
jgi:hypothetical protein